MICSYPLPEIWLEIVGRIAAIRERCRCEWSEEEVYRSILDNRAFLFCDDEGGSFAVVKTLIDSGTDEKVLFVWIGYGEKGYLDLLKEIARETGCSRMEMGSPRKGFERTSWGVKERRKRDILYSMEVL